MCSVCGVWVQEDGQTLTDGEIQALKLEHIVYAPAKEVRITLNGEAVPATADMADGTVLALTGEVLPAAAKQELQWTSSAPAVASVDGEGRVTLLKNGKATITATGPDRRSARVTIQVLTRVRTVEITSKTGAAQVAAGKTLALGAQVLPADATNKRLVWSIVSGGEYAQVSTSGLVTAKKNGAGGAVEVSAAAADGSGVYGTFTLTVHPITASLTIEEGRAGSLDISKENTLTLHAQIRPEEAGSRVLWSSGSEKIATVDENGVVTMLKPGTVTITARAADGSGKSAQYKITATASMTGLALAEGCSVAEGRSLTLKPVIEPADATNKKLSWTLEEAVPGVTLTNGVLRAKAGTAPNVVTVVATAQDGSGCKARTQVAICPIATGVQLYQNGAALTAKNLTVSVGEALHLDSGVKPETAAQSVRWTSSNPSVLAVEAAETGVTLVPRKPGTVTVTAAAADGSGKSASVRIMVSQSVESLSMPETAVLAGGRSLTLKPVIGPANATNKKLSWTLEETVPGVTLANGVLRTKAVTEPITVTVVATAQDGSGCEARTQVTICPIATGVQLYQNGAALTAKTLTVPVGEALHLDSGVKPAMASQSVRWTSGNTSVLAVETAETGVTLVPRKPGTVTVTAAAADGSGKSASVRITVVQPMESLRMPEAAVLAGGRSLTLRPVIGPGNATNKKLSWTLEGSASGVTLANGVLRTKAVTEPIAVTVVATAQDGSGCVARTQVTIYPAATSLALTWNGETVTGKTRNLPLNQLAVLSAQVNPSGACQQVNWTSSNPGVAIVSSDGVVIPVKAGRVAITAAAADGTGKRAVVTLVIK